MEEFFAPEGLIAKYHPHYEYRPGQVEMAKAVLAVMREGGCLLTEAGTGTGKTLAYLVPALALGKRVIVSTATKNLQEQLYNKDVPFLEKILARKLRVAYLKGRANYLCLYRFKQAENSPVLYGLEDINYFDKIGRWASLTETGDRAELVDLPENISFWHSIDARSDICIGSKCPDFENCFITRARQRSEEADIVIVNHHLFFADLALRKDDYGSVLPDYDTAIFDEAHEIEDIAADYFSAEISNHKLSDLIHDVSRLVFTDHENASELMHVLSRVSMRAETFWLLLQQQNSNEGRYTIYSQLFIQVDEDENKTLTPLGESYVNLKTALQRLTATLKNTKDAPPELAPLIRRAESLWVELEFIVNCNDKTFVYWYEKRGRSLLLQAAPINVSAILSERLFDKAAAIVLTSATLASADSFSFIRTRLGLNSARELKIESHFDFSKQALLYLPPQMPDPRTPQFKLAAALEIIKILELTQGRAFVLFTSLQQMKEVYELVQLEIPFPTFIQGQGSKAGILERFRETPNAVLFAVASFWQGVDVQGEALSCVIIDKLPFAVPTDPVIAARYRYIDANGGNSFMDYSVPQAIITLKQGLGRLIRSSKDRGILSILDPRLKTKGYGRTFLASLPPYPVTTRREDISTILSKE